ncbi:S-type anion channel SLAH4 [Vigna radiata var. radiata]|uniref:S-type anion channel SLAH4 n=1 Tax=Vigna radiata var. radiata TaxID=3916 RepID=A0A1S3UT95_VIGRR|nr:S-type anion channel SLAH4 [Vigna radiata var. radiata]
MLHSKISDSNMKAAVDVIEGDSMNNTNPTEITKPSSHSRLPILTKIHVGYFFICLSFGAQALLWKSLSKHNQDSNSLWHGFNFMPSFAFLLLWCVALFVATTLSLLYVLKCIFHFDVVKEEFSHYIGVNCMYAPWISWLLMLQSAPMILHTNCYYRALCLAFSFVILFIDIKLYGQWFTTKRRFLSIVANPTSQVSVIGNLVSARVIAEIGWKEIAVVMFSIGSVFYLVIFITLYQRQKNGNQFPTVLRPAYFLFFAAPSMASLTWKSILGDFVTPSKMLLFLSLFLFMSQACRPAMFKKSMKRLNVTWWLYSFPLTFLGLACGEYAEDVKSGMAPWLMLVICMLSVLVFIALMIVTVLRIEMLLNKNAPFIS